MSEFEKWFKSLNENGRVTYFLGQESKIAEEAWFASACTSIDHIHRLQHEKANQKAEIEQLKAEKAGLEERIESGLSLAEKWAAIEFEKTTHWSEGYEDGCLHCSLQLDKALRGEHE